MYGCGTMEVVYVCCKCYTTYISVATGTLFLLFQQTQQHRKRHTSTLVRKFNLSVCTLTWIFCESSTWQTRTKTPGYHKPTGDPKNDAYWSSSTSKTQKAQMTKFNFFMSTYTIYTGTVGLLELSSQSASL